MTARVLLVDNYDSFVGNLYQYAGELGAEPAIRRNDGIGVEEARAMGITHLVVSPGPGTPADAGNSVELIRAFAGVVPVLGICLGHQCVGAAFGAGVHRAGRVVHGKACEIVHDGGGVLRGIPSPLTAGRYHSLVLREDDLPPELLVAARSGDGEVMAVRHRDLDPPVEGLQFHPESILTPLGRRIMENFLG